MRALKVVLLLLIVLGICFLNLTLAVLNPEQSISPEAEAVLVFAGGNGQRFDLGLELAETYDIKYIFLSIGAIVWVDQRRVLEHCEAKHDSHIVVCVQTDLETDNTRGEAKLFAEGATKLGLEHLVVVSGRSHVYRASLNLARCFEGVVDRMGTPEIVTKKSLVHEWLGILHARLNALVGC